jgi:hypothetical protein
MYQVESMVWINLYFFKSRVVIAFSSITILTLSVLSGLLCSGIFLAFAQEETQHPPALDYPDMNDFNGYLHPHHHHPHHSKSGPMDEETNPAILSEQDQW